MKTVQQIVDAFGGPPQFARFFDIHLRTVYTWRRRNYIDPEYDVQIVTEAKRRKIQLDYEDLAKIRAPIKPQRVS